MTSSAALLVWLAAVPVVRFQAGDDSKLPCPAHAELARALARSLPAARVSPGAPRGDDVQVRFRRDARWHFEVHRANGAVALARTLPAELGCAEVAEAAALMLERWLSEIAWPGAPAPPPARPPERRVGPPPDAAAKVGAPLPRPAAVASGDAGAAAATHAESSAPPLLPEPSPPSAQGSPTAASSVTRTPASARPASPVPVSPTLASPASASPASASPASASPASASPASASPASASPASASSESATPTSATPTSATPTSVSDSSAPPEHPGSAPSAPPVRETPGAAPAAPQLSTPEPETPWRALVAVGGGVWGTTAPAAAPHLWLEPALEHASWRLGLLAVAAPSSSLTVSADGFDRGTLHAQPFLFEASGARCWGERWGVCAGAVAGARLTVGTADGPYLYRTASRLLVTPTLGPEARLTWRPASHLELAATALASVCLGSGALQVEGTTARFDVPRVDFLAGISVGWRP